MNFKKFNLSDIALTKVAVLFATLFLISAFPVFANLVIKINWAWFLVISLILAIKPMIKAFKK